MSSQAQSLDQVIVAPREREVTAGRILSIDALRGVALALMALDHGSFFVGAGLQAESYGGQPVMLQSPAYWVSGLLTNLATPIFWLLSGYSLALLSASRLRRGGSQGEITRFILTRAGIIIAVDLVVCNALWLGSTPYVHVLTAIGVAMLLLSGLRRLPDAAILGLSLAVLLGHQAMIEWMAAPLAANAPQPFWQAFWLTYSYDTQPALGFAVLGWGPLMWAGYVLGRRQHSPVLRQPRTWVYAGAALLMLWLGLRMLGGYGDLGSYHEVSAGWASFLIMCKAPPSLTYLAFNLGLAALLMALLYRWAGWLARPPFSSLVLIGQVSLFFYVGHLAIYHLLAQLSSRIALPGPQVIWGYLAWLVGLVLLLPLAAGYRRLRKRYPQVLSYF